MKTSARNQIDVKIVKIKKGAVNSEIIAKAGGNEFVAIITNESAKSLDLEKGDKAVFLIKASNIIVAK